MCVCVCVCVCESVRTRVRTYVYVHAPLFACVSAQMHLNPTSWSLKLGSGGCPSEEHIFNPVKSAVQEAVRDYT